LPKSGSGNRGMKIGDGTGVGVGPFGGTGQGCDTYLNE
jgi:hypothetical protein